MYGSQTFDIRKLFLQIYVITNKYLCWLEQKPSNYFYFIYFFGFLGLHLQHMDVSRLGVEWELQLLAYTTATATWDPEPAKQSQGLNPSPMDTNWVLNPLSHYRNSQKITVN